MNFRALKNSEFEFIKITVSQLSPKIVTHLQERRTLLYMSVSGDKNKNLIYLIADNHKKVLTHFQKNAKIISVGTYLGFITRRQFFLSLEGAELLLGEKLIPEQRLIQVNNAGEKAILYGNPIEKKMILDLSSNLKKDSFILILNLLNELVAIGNVEVDLEDFEFLNERDILIKNLVDKGYYLRRKQ